MAGSLLFLLTDIRENDVMQDIAVSIGWFVDIDVMAIGVGREKLLQNTQEALERGSFGVPRLKNVSIIPNYQCRINVGNVEFKHCVIT